LLAEFYKLDINKINFLIMPSNENIELSEDAELDKFKIYLQIGDKAIKYKKTMKMFLDIRMTLLQVGTVLHHCRLFLLCL
jgi:hypothetical protein